MNIFPSIIVCSILRPQIGYRTKMHLLGFLVFKFFLQFSGKEYTEKEILKKVKDVWTKDLKNKVGDMKDVKIYLKPEESAAYYVVNGDTTGKIDL